MAAALHTARRCCIHRRHYGLGLQQSFMHRRGLHASAAAGAVPPPRVPPRPRSSRSPGSRPGNALVVKAQPKPIKAVEFRLGYGRARSKFLNWSERHGALKVVQAGSGQLEQDLWDTVTGTRGIGGEEQDLFSARPVFVPFYSFKLADGSYRHVYAGSTFDAVSLQVSLTADLDDAAMDASIGGPFNERLRLVDGAAEPAHLDEWTLGVEAAWAMVQAASYGLDDGPLGVGRVLLPAWCFGYKHIGVTMLTWVSGISGDVSGISHLAFWEDESLRQDFKNALGGAVKTLADSTSHLNPTVRYEVTTTAIRGAIGVGSMVFTAARRHPKIMLASLAAPFLYKLVKPAVQSVYQQLTSDRPGDRASIGSDPGKVNWEFLLNRGLGAGQAGGEEAARLREVDTDCPYSILGLRAPETGGRLSHGQLQRAFRKELLLHHPDHRPAGEQAEAARRTQLIVAAYNGLRAQCT